MLIPAFTNPIYEAGKLELHSRAPGKSNFNSVWAIRGKSLQAKTLAPRVSAGILLNQPGSCTTASDK